MNKNSSENCKIDPLDQWPSWQMTLWPMTFFTIGTYEQWVSQLNDMLHQQYSHHPLQLQRASQLGPLCLESIQHRHIGLIDQFNFFLMFTQLLGSLDSVLDPWFQNTDVSKDRGFTALVVTAGKTSTYNKHTESMEWHHYIFTVLRMEISLGTFFSNLFSIYKHCNIPAYLYCKLQSYSFC